MEAGDTAPGPAVLHLSSLHTNAHLVPGAECPGRPHVWQQQHRGGGLADVARDHRKHRVVLGFWNQKSGCRDLQTLPGRMQSMQVPALRTWGDSAPSGWLPCPPSSGSPDFASPGGFCPREEGTNASHQAESTHYIIACFLFFKSL